MDKNTNIIELYNQLERGKKTPTQRVISEETGKSMNTIKSHWFPNHDIPEEHQDTVISVLQNAIREQNAKTHPA